MRKSMVILGLTSSLIALIMAISIYYPYSYIPVVISLLFGLIAFYQRDKQEYPKKPIQFIFIVAIIAISISIYKSVYIQDLTESNVLLKFDDMYNDKFRFGCS